MVGQTLNVTLPWTIWDGNLLNVCFSDRWLTISTFRIQPKYLFDGPPPRLSGWPPRNNGLVEFELDAPLTPNWFGVENMLSTPNSAAFFSFTAANWNNMKTTLAA